MRLLALEVLGERTELSDYLLIKWRGRDHDILDLIVSAQQAVSEKS